MVTSIERAAGLCIGRIERVSAAEIRVVLYSETPQATALNTGVPTGFPRINAYLLIPNESGAVVAVVKEIYITREPPEQGWKDDAFVDLPFPARTLFGIPFGTLTREGNDENHQPAFRLERGVPVLPSVGDPVLLPTPVQLRSIVEAQTDDRLIQVGTAPFAGNARVWVHPDKLFGRHLAVLGNTGSGKSCSVAGVVRWSLEAAAGQATGNHSTNARFVILDPNGEYTAAFKDGAIPMRRYAVNGADGARPLVVPGWLWNGQEWAAVTSAQGGVQRPLLMKALRLLRNAGAAVMTARSQALRRYQGYVRQIEQFHADLPQSVSGFPRDRDFGQSLEGLLGMIQTDERDLGAYGPGTADLVAAIVAVRAPIEAVRISRYYTSANSSGYNNFQPNDLTTLLAQLRGITDAFDAEAGQGELSEDAPVKFEISALPERIRDVALATGGQALSNVEPLINRIQVMLGDPRLRPVISSEGAESLAEWLKRFLGPSEGSPEPLAIVDLSLVPSDVIHVAVGVIGRLIFEAVQASSQGVRVAAADCLGSGGSAQLRTERKRPRHERSSRRTMSSDVRTNRQRGSEIWHGPRAGLTTTIRAFADNLGAMQFVPSTSNRE